MRLIFPFKNLAINSFLELINDKTSIYDYILTQQDRYPFAENFFLYKVDHFKDNLPNYENEILQIINTTNQATIDTYFEELLGNVNYIRQKITLEDIQLTVNNWNEETLKLFEEKVEKETEDYFKSKDRERKHLEEYEAWDFAGNLGFWNNKHDAKKIKRVNYNFYCIKEQPDLIDITYCKEYQTFLVGLAEDFFEIAKRYGIPYEKGEIISKVGQVVFNKPVVFVEGDHDITYIRKAAELLNQKEILEKIELRQRGGWTNLDKIWEIYKDNNWETVPQKKLLLYDCDTKKQDEETGVVFKRIITTIPDNIVSKGIENLFPNEIIEKAIKEKNAFIDITKIHTTKRGVVSETTNCEVNKDEKKNLCNWICQNGTADDFKNFEKVFDLMKIVL